MQVTIPDEDVDETLSAIASALIALNGSPDKAKILQVLYFRIRHD